jgi:hypothetical protein
MNSNYKLDPHPDAESLNAFVEQALTEQERGPILAHLAECGRCRQVVYLAHQAAEMEAEPELAVAAAAPRSAAWKESWFRSWRLAWVTAGALAVTMTAAYVVHVRRVEIAAGQARDAREAATRNTDMALTPQTPRLGTQVAPPPAVAPALSVTNTLKQQTPTMAPKQLTLTAMPEPAGEAGAMSSSRIDEVAPPPGASGTGYSAMSAGTKYELKPVVAERQQEEEERAAAALEAGKLATEKRSLASANEPAKRAAPNGGMLAPATSSAQIDADPVHAGSFDAGVRHGENLAFAVSRVKPAELPSGLPAVSTVKARGSSLAVDRTGAVFLSGDLGKRR